LAMNLSLPPEVKMADKLARPAGRNLLSEVVMKTEPDMILLECFNTKTDNLRDKPELSPEVDAVRRAGGLLAVSKKIRCRCRKNLSVLQPDATGGYIPLKR